MQGLRVEVGGEERVKHQTLLQVWWANHTKLASLLTQLQFAVGVLCLDRFVLASPSKFPSK
jgi:hypothetical protein